MPAGLRCALALASLRKPTTCWPAAFSSAMAAGHTCLSRSFQFPTTHVPAATSGSIRICQAAWPTGPPSGCSSPEPAVRVPGTCSRLEGSFPLAPCPSPPSQPVQAQLRDRGAPRWVTRSWSPPALPFLPSASALALNPATLTMAPAAGPAPLCALEDPGCARSPGPQGPSTGPDPAARWEGRLLGP